MKPSGGKPKENKLVERGRRKRDDILSASVDIASVEGLEGLTIGRLALDLKMSKSGLFAHFGSKEDLQLQTVRRARDVFIAAIVTPAAGIERGLARLSAMLENWIRYLEESVFRGGCFFFAVSAEMDDRPGRVRDLIAHLTHSWVHGIEDEIRIAIAHGEFRKDTAPKLLAFQLHSFVQEANWLFRLHEEPEAFKWARQSISERIESHRKNEVSLSTDKPFQT